MHVVESNVAIRFPERFIAVLFPVVVFVDQLENAIGRHESHLDIVETVGHRPHRTKEEVNEEDEGRQLPESHRSMEHPLSAIPYQQGESEGHDDFHDREEDGVVKDSPDVRIAVGRIDVFKAPVFCLFPVEQLYHLHAGDALLHKGIEPGHLVAHVLKTVAHADAETVRGIHQQRQDTQRDQGQLPVHAEHEEEDDDDLEDIAGDGDQAGSKKIGDGFDITDGARHAGSDGCFVEEAHAQRNQVAVHVLAQQTHHFLSGARCEVSSQKGDEGLKQEQCQQQESHTVQPGDIAHGHIAVERFLDQPGLEPDEKALDNSEECRENQQAAMRSRDAQHPAEQTEVEARKPDFHRCKGEANAANWQPATEKKLTLPCAHERQAGFAHLVL